MKSLLHSDATLFSIASRQRIWHGIFGRQLINTGIQKLTGQISSL